MCLEKVWGGGRERELAAGGGGGGGGLFRGGGRALREANIFSGLRQHSENTLLMLMCIRSEPGKY